MDLLAWWNLIFVLPFVAALMYLLFQTFSGLAVEYEGDADIGHDVDLDHDVSLDVDHDVDLDVDHDVDLDADHDVHADVEHDMGIEHSTEFGQGHEAVHGDNTGSLLKALSFLGIGRVPISLIGMTFCFIWGFTGWASNMLLGSVLKYPALFVWPSIAIALVCTIIFTRISVNLLSKVMPSTETYATKNQHLVGRRAKAIYNITEKSGASRLHDDYGNLLDIGCRVSPGDQEIPAGNSVVLMRYDHEQKAFLVKPDMLGEFESSVVAEKKG